jgi:hypothetical protein
MLRQMWNLSGIEKMKLSLVACAALALAVSAQAQTSDNHGRLRGICPVRVRQETRDAYVTRANDRCEVRWRELFAAQRTGDETHDHFIDRCRRKCADDWGREAVASGGVTGTATLIPLTLSAGYLVGFGFIALTPDHNSAGGGGPPPASP